MHFVKLALDKSARRLSNGLGWQRSGESAKLTLLNKIMEPLGRSPLTPRPQKKLPSNSSLSCENNSLEEIVPNTRKEQLIDPLTTSLLFQLP
jgi:hypothetical protein